MPFHYARSFPIVKHSLCNTVAHLDLERCLDVRLHGRRTDVTAAEIDSVDSHSVMSADSIDPSESHELLKKPKAAHQYAPIKNLIHQWTTTPKKTPFLDAGEKEGKDFLTVSAASNRKQKRMVTTICKSVLDRRLIFRIAALT